MKDEEIDALLKQEMDGKADITPNIVTSNPSTSSDEKPQRGVLEHKIITGFTLRSYPNGLLVKVSGSEWIKIDNNPTLYKKKKSEPVKEIPKTELMQEEVH